MKRTRQAKKADAILTADWHLQENTPVCRTDNFYETQWSKLDFISSLQKEHSCMVLHAGDLFDHWKPSPMLLSDTIVHLPDKFFTVYGNHDLPQHNIELSNKSGIYTLEKAGKLNVLKTCHWLETPSKPSLWNDYSIGAMDIKILVWHVFCYQGGKPFPGAKGRASGFLRKYKDYHLILTGDNHETFTETYENRLLVNPGSIFRLKTNQKTHRPCVFLYYAETNSVKKVFIPIKENVINEEHIQEKNERNERLNVFINSLTGDYEKGNTLENNLENFMVKNNTKESIKQIVYKSLED